MDVWQEDRALSRRLLHPAFWGLPWIIIAERTCNKIKLVDYYTLFFSTHLCSNFKKFGFWGNVKDLDMLNLERHILTTDSDTFFSMTLKERKTNIQYY